MTIGGKFTAYNGVVFVDIIEFEKGRKLVQHWQTKMWPEGWEPSVLEFQFNGKGNGTGTEVVMTHRVPPDLAEHLSQGWVERYWNPLKKYFGG